MGTSGRPQERLVVIDGSSFRLLHSPGPVGAGPAFVLVHGIGVSHRYYARLHEQLARTAPVYALDLPGFGGLPKPGRDLSIVDMAALIAAVLDDAGIADAILVGHSMGSQWVVELAVQRPDLASHVVVIGPVTDERHRSAVAQAVALGIDTLGEPPRANAIVFADYLRCGSRWHLTQLRHMLTYPIEDRVAMLQMPLLVMRGGSDPVSGLEWCRRLRDNAVDGVLVQVPGGNHLVQYSAARAVRSAIHAFVSEESTAARREVA